MGRKTGLLLSGCGVSDGSEIHEAVLTMFFLDRAGIEIIHMAPDIKFDEINHLTDKKTGSKRNALAEAARIARGNIKNIKDVNPSDFDALIIPGGLGAIKNLSDFAEKGAEAVVHPEVERLILETNRALKPVGAICIAPAVVAKVLSHKNITVTIGTDQVTASKITAMGCSHADCNVDGIVTDKDNKIVTTPAYMLGPGVKDIALGIEKLVNQIVAMI